MSTASIHPTFSRAERLLGRGVAVTLWVVSVAVILSLAVWTGGPPVMA